MIPKIIHYCWFGKGEKPKLAQKCIKSWYDLCPDYEIIEWNEDNFEIGKYPYAKFCYDTKRWAFLSDFVRLLVVYENGGIYFDTDVELIKRPDDLLKYESFFGFENNDFVATGLGFGGEVHNKAVGAMLKQYLDMKSNSNGEFEIIGCPNLNTKALLPFGLVTNGKRQSIECAEIFPIDFFNPFDDATGRLNITENTYSINRYGKSWMDKKKVLRSRLTRPFHRIFGQDCFKWIKKRNQ